MKNPKGIISVSVAMTLLALAVVATGATYFFTRNPKTSKSSTNVNIVLNTNAVANTNFAVTNENTNIVVNENVNTASQQNVNNAINSNTNVSTNLNTNTPNTGTSTYSGSIDGIHFSFNYPSTQGVLYNAQTELTYIFPDKDKISLANDPIIFSLWTMSEQDVVDAQVNVATAIANYACAAGGPRGDTDCLAVSENEVIKLKTDTGAAYSVFTPTLRQTENTFNTNDELTGSTTKTRLHGPFAFYYNATKKKYIYFNPDSGHIFTASDIADAKKIFSTFQISN